MNHMTNASPGHDLDLSFLEEIADGSIEFMVESIDMFLEHTPEALKTIKAAMGNQEWAIATSAAHKLKPNLGFFGMVVSQALMQELELMAKTGAPDINEFSSKFYEVSEIINDTIISLIDIKAEKEAQL